MSLGGVRHSLGEEDATKRRKAIALTSKALAAFLWSAVFETVDRLGIGNFQGQVDGKTIAAHQEVSQALAEPYRSDPHHILSIMTAYADQLLDLLDTPMSDRDRAALNTIVVGVHAQAGLWACHMHRPSLAYRYLATSREVAAASDDRSLQARSLGALSYSFARGWLLTWRADQHPTLRDLDAARADVELADIELDSTDSGQLESFFARPTYGYGMRGHLNSVHAVVLLVQVGCHDSEAVCAALGTSIQLAAQEHYVMGSKRAIGVRHCFDACWTTLPAVRDLDDQLHYLPIS